MRPRQSLSGSGVRVLAECEPRIAGSPAQRPSAQVALALAPPAAACILTGTFQSLRNVDAGFLTPLVEAQTVAISMPEGSTRDFEGRRFEFSTDIQDFRLAAVTGVGRGRIRVPCTPGGYGSRVPDSSSRTRPPQAPRADCLKKSGDT